MNKFFTKEFVMILAIILFIMSIHGLLLSVIDYNQEGTMITLLILIYGVYAVYNRCCCCIEII